MSLAKTSLWTASSTLVKIGVGLLIIKLLALSFGPEGVGFAGNFRQLITVLGVLAGAGIFNGITKYVAEYQQQPEHLKYVVGTSSTIILCFSAILAILFFTFSRTISELLFNSADYYQVIQAVALIQIGIAYTNFILALFKGYRDAVNNALSIIIGALLGVAAYVLCYYFADYSGALVGLALVPALALIPAAFLLYRGHYFPLSYLRCCWHRQSARALWRYTLMAIITCITLPVAYVLMRNLLAESHGWKEVGYWQGATTISDAYLQFITASFSVYLLPTLSRLTLKHEITKELLRSLRFVFFAVSGVSLLIWLFRDLIIYLLFSDAFMPMRDLFSWQLIGDILKVSCYVFGYLVIAKASLRFYILAEISQFTLLMLFSHWLIPLHGALGATQAYMLSYIVYFILCGITFFIYSRK